MDSILFLLLFQVVLIALNAVFASAEIAVLSINEAKLERMSNEGNHKARRLFKLTREPAKFLATIQVAITLSGFLGSAFAADNFSEPLVDWVMGMGIRLPRATLDAIAVVVITLILSYFTLIFGELVPKRLAMKKSEQIAMGISGLVSGISVVFRPIVWFLSVSTNLVLCLCGVDPNEAEDMVSEEEIRMMVDAGSEKGTIDTHEKEFIQNVFEFNDSTAKEVAIHRTEVAVLWMEDDIEAWEQTIFKERHTLYPVCDGSPDNVIGILNAKDYFPLKIKTKETVLETAVHPAFFVPETIKADVLFRNMKREHTSMSVVLDEYGGVVGIVTLQDLVEELVGDLGDDIPDAVDPEPYVESIDDVSWKIHGNISLEDLAKTTGLELPIEEYDTFTGMIFDELGAIPSDGEQKISLEMDAFIVHLQKIEAHQIEMAMIQIKTSEEIHDVK